MGRVLLIACTNVGRAIIDEIENNEDLKEVELVGVVDLNSEVAVNKANYDAYTDLALKYNLNMYYCEDVNETECLDFIRNLEPDIIIQSGWSQKFGDELLAIPKYACIGEHPAPLPKGRGAACINWAIITGETDWGDTFFKMEQKYDTGEIYGQSFFRIELYDDVKTVYDKVASAAVETVRKNIVGWSNGILEGTAQTDEGATHYPRRRPSDGEFDFNQSALSIYNQIRGQARPYPGAFFISNIGGKKTKVYVWKATLDIGEKQDGGVNVKCGDGNYIRLLRIQPEGMTEKWGIEYQGHLE